MFSSKNFIHNVYQVPSTWIFETYLGLAEPLSGQRVRMNSIFNPADKNPSMFLYYDRDNDVYKYKCFSTGKGGSAIDIIMEKEGLGFKDAVERADEIIAGGGTAVRSESKRRGRAIPRRTWDI